MTIDWSSLEQAARIVAGPGPRTDGTSLLRLRNEIVGMLEDASTQVHAESGLAPEPPAELLVVDRHGWIGGNLSTFEQLFEGIEVSGSEARLLAWEGGAFLGFIARAVLGQYDPFTNRLIIVYPNLRDFGTGDALRWLLFHEVTHVAQFRAAPWMPDHIRMLGRRVLSLQRSGFGREFATRLREHLPEIVMWLRDVLKGKAESSPIFDLLPEEQRAAIFEVNALVTLLEGHATYVTELIAEKAIPDYASLKARIEARKQRSPLVKILEAIAGLEMKRQQYVVGRSFCETIWQNGGPDVLAPAWRGPEWSPSMDELREPQLWLDRVASRSSA